MASLRAALGNALLAPVLVFAWLVAQIPLRFTTPIGEQLGRLLMRVLKSRQKIARTNLQLCFPELTAVERDDLLQRNARSMGLSVLEFTQAWWGRRSVLPPITSLVGLEHLATAQAQGRGVLLVSGHFHTLELCGRLLTQHVQVAGMYRPHDQALLEWAVEKGRARYASHMFTREQLKASIKHLKNGGILWYAPDQDYRRGDHVFAPFFGIQAATLKATHQFARLANACVIAFAHRRDGAGYALELSAPLQDFPSHDPVADSARINALIETMVRQAPAEYLWVHQRFKTRPAGATSLY